MEINFRLVSEIRRKCIVTVNFCGLIICSVCRYLIITSPAAIYSCELSSPEEINHKNKEVKQTLELLAATLKEQLKQESVFIVYRDENWCA